MEGYRVEGHSLPSYFMGQIVTDPGLFFYPVALFLRLSAVTTIGLFVALWVVLRSLWPFHSEKARWSVFGGLLFSIVLVLLMTVASKKLDRYILPATLTLDLIAVGGWLGAIAYGSGHYARSDRSETKRGRIGLFGLAVAGLLLLHAMQAFSRYPYYALSFNPLAGGNRTAPHALLIGWGEGLNEVGDWLSEQRVEERGNQPLHVVSWYEDGPLSYYLPGDSQVLSFIESDNYWFDADYVVLYVNQWQRENPDPEMITHFLNQEPVYEVSAAGMELAKVYDVRSVTPPPFTRIYTDSPADFDERLHLSAYRLGTRSIVPGESVKMTIFLKAIGVMEQNYLVHARLLDQSGAIVWQEERWPSGSATSDWPIDQIRQDTYVLIVPADIEPGLFTVQYAVIDPKTRQPLAVQSEQPPTLDGYHAVTTINVQAPEPIAIDAVWEPVRVTELAHVSRIQPGQNLLVDLHAEGQVDGSIKMSLRLVDAEGKTQAQQDKDLLSDLRYSLAVPGDAVEGSYALSVVVYDGATQTPFMDQDGESPTTLSHVEIGSPAGE